MMEGYWAIVELMGHVRLGGYVTEVEQFGAKLGRIDIHSGEQVVTQFFGGSSVYRITPTTEEVARAIGKNAPAPVHAWELPARSEAEYRPDSDDDEAWARLGGRGSDGEEPRS